MGDAEQPARKVVGACAVAEGAEGFEEGLLGEVFDDVAARDALEQPPTTSKTRPARKPKAITDLLF